jgi:hypothetical protein
MEAGRAAGDKIPSIKHQIPNKLVVFVPWVFGDFDVFEICCLEFGAYLYG